MTQLLETITTVLGKAITWVGTVIQAFFGTPAADSTAGALANLLPYLALGMGIGILGLGVKYVRSFIKIG